MWCSVGKRSETAIKEGIIMPGGDGTGPLGKGPAYGGGFGGGRRRMRRRFAENDQLHKPPEPALPDSEAHKSALKRRIETLQEEMETIRKELADLESVSVASRR
jgi:hypothetical protein